jgi:hypothetical protein
MQPNIELMDRVMTHIRLYPEQHDQESFGRLTECGSAHCFGGWAVALIDGTESFRWSNDIVVGVIVNGQRWDVDRRASFLLGVDGWKELDTVFSNYTVETYDYDCEEEDCYCAETQFTNPSLFSEVNTVDDLAERVEYYRSMVA